MNIIVRSAKSEDIPELVAVQKQAWLDAYPNKEYGITKEDVLSKDFDSEEKIRARQDSLSIKSSRVSYVAVTEDRVVGFAGGYKHEDRNELSAIYVHPEFYRFGIGKKLAEAIFEDLGKNTLWEVRIAQYNKQAIKFYKSLGFRLVGQIEDYILPNGKAMPLINMIKTTDD